MRKYKVVQVPDPETGDLIETTKLSPTKYANTWTRFAEPIVQFTGWKLTGVNPDIHLTEYRETALGNTFGITHIFSTTFIAKFNKLLKQYQALEEELRLLKEKYE